MARIATIHELGPYAGIKEMGKADTDLLQLLLDAAEAFFERYTGRIFSPLPALVNGADTGTPVTKLFSARGKRLVRIPDLREVTAVTLDGSALTRDSDFWFDSYVQPATQFELSTYGTVTGRAELSITGRWGMNPPPPEAKSAVLLLAGRTYRRKDALFSDVVTTETAQFVYSRNMPEEVLAAASLFRIPNLAVV